MGVTLAADIGRYAARAVVGGSEGRQVPLLIDGAAHLSPGVAVDADALRTGDAARATATWWVPDVAARLGGPPVAHDGRQVDPVDLYAAVLARLAAEATAATGQPVDRLVLVVPHDWGPRRHGAVGDAAARARLPAPELVTAPVAVATHVAASTVVAVGATIAVVDLGASAARATVLTRTGAASWEIRAALADPAGAGDRVDEALHAVLGLAPPDGPTARAAVGEAKAAAVRTGTGFLAGDPGGVTAVPAHLLATAAAPVLDAAAALLARAVEAADADPRHIALVAVAGGGALLPGAATAFARDDTPVTVAARPEQAGALGAATTGTAPAWVAPAGASAVIGPSVGLVVAAAASLALFVLALNTLEPETGYILFGWSVLACAAVTAIIAGLLAGRAVVLAWLERPATAGERRTSVPARLLLTAVAAATVSGFLMALMIAAVWGLPVDWFLPTVAGAALPAAGLAAVAAALTVRLGHLGSRAVDRLQPSAAALLVGTAGVLAYHYASYDLAGTEATALGHLGGAAVGLAAGVLLLRRVPARAAAGAVAAVIVGLVAVPGYDLAGWIWLGALYLWFAQAMLATAAEAFPGLGGVMPRARAVDRGATGPAATP